MCIEAVKNNEGAMKSVPKKMRETIKIEVDKQKKELVGKILNQQETIANQQEEINKLNSQKKELQMKNNAKIKKLKDVA